MRTPFAQKDIRYWCGTASYKRGQQYFEDGRVLELTYDAIEDAYEAIVEGSGQSVYHVWLRPDDDWLEADCDCPAYDSYNNYCKHIAATMFAILYDAAHLRLPLTLVPEEAPAAQSKPQVSSRERQLAHRFLTAAQSIASSSQDRATYATREQVGVSYIILVTDPYSQQPYLSIGMRVGVKRLYKVPKIREFLEKVQTQQSHTFTKNFTYLPDAHFFSDTDVQIIQELVALSAIERELFRHNNPYSLTNMPSRDLPQMGIPASVFHKILPLLSKSNVELQVRDAPAERPASLIAEGQLPLRFEVFKDHSGAYVLDLQDLQGLVVLPDYGFAIYGGQLYMLPWQQLELLGEAVTLIKYEAHKRILVEATELSVFMERVLPQLQQIGEVAVEEGALSEVKHVPLQPDLYLDAEGQAMTIDLVFKYGDVSIRPLQAGDGRIMDTFVGPSASATAVAATVERFRTDDGPLLDADGRTIIRDRKLEEGILALFNGIPLRQLQPLDSRVALVDDEAIYDFVYEVLPLLDGLVDVYATNAIDPITDASRARLRTSVDVRGNQLLDVQFDIEGIDAAEVQAVLQSITEKKRYHRLQNGAFVRLEAQEYEELGRLMEDFGVRPSAVKGGKVAIPLMQGFHALPSYDQSNQVKLGRKVRGLVDDILHPDRLEFRVPENLHATLRDYQQIGFQWMSTLAHYGFGGILADDMGLGKTIQSIAFILSELQTIRSAKTPVLIVSPSSLIYNWRNELERFAPDVSAVVVAGNVADREASLGRFDTADVYITSYPLLRMDGDKYASQVFHTVILDEAQAIKNHLTLTAQTVRTLQASHRFALTGTPIENSLDELWSIFHFAFPAMFPNHKAFSQMKPEGIARRVRPFILRRLKQDVLKELPDKIETLQTSELTADQKKLYLAYLERIQQDSAAEIAQQGFQKSRMKILAGLTRLRQICCHPALFVENYRGSSGKLEQLIDLLEECRASGKRALIFSQFTQMLGVIRDTLEKGGVDAFYLDGATPVQERTILCDRFNAGERDVFLISLKAGGTGLNLTGADTVILYDLWWNPAVEDQAADRAHRIGQKNVVQVIRMVARGTIEERIYQLQQQKRNLIDQVVEQGDAGLSTLTEEEIRELLSL